MERSQKDHRNISLKLSEVLSDVGVNEEMVMRRRNGTLFREWIECVDSVMTNNHVNHHYFGSQSEGTTTIGLHSDIDLLRCFNRFHVIQDWADWKPNVTNLLMVQDETTAPGYCLLQFLQKDAPIPESRVSHDVRLYKDVKGRILAKNTLFHNFLDFLDLTVQHGPAVNVPEREHVEEKDCVQALHCERWPTQGRPWLHRRSLSGWPSVHLKTVSERSGCFLVPVGSKLNELHDLEWRISTSFAERYLMFSLNITHLRCYVLMKLMLKTHINRGCDNVISSYMCKTAVLHCAEKTNIVFWQGPNMFLRLNQILRELYDYVLNINCPHFIIPENNLMAGRISAEQQQRLLGNIQHIIDSNGSILFEIQTDGIGARLQIKLNTLREIPGSLPSIVLIRMHVSRRMVYNAAREIIFFHTRNMGGLNNEDNILVVIQQLLCMFNRCEQHYADSSSLEQEAYILMLPLLCSTIGSLMAAFNIMLNKPFSDIAFEWLKLGVDSDVASGWLKLATVYYSTGENNATETILRHIYQRYDRSIVIPMCGCNPDKATEIVPGFDNVAHQIQNDDIGRFVSYCVIFTPCECNIVPHEMQLEYSRSTQEDIQCRNFIEQLWMNFAVVDSLPYLYFLQYKTYGRLNNRREQERALYRLQHVIRDERNLSHKETVLNLLGQCMEQENLPNEAFICYESSLLVRPRHNAARIHRARVLLWMFVKFHDGISKDAWIKFMKKK